MKILLQNFAQKLVDADRASLFLVDSKTQEIYARIFDISQPEATENGDGMVVEQTAHMEGDLLSPPINLSHSLNQDGQKEIRSVDNQQLNSLCSPMLLLQFSNWQRHCRPCGIDWRKFEHHKRVRGWALQSGNWLTDRLPHPIHPVHADLHSWKVRILACMNAVQSWHLH